MQKALLLMVAMITGGIVALNACDHGGQNNGGGLGATPNAVVLDENGDPVVGGTVWIPCPGGNACGGFVASEIKSNPLALSNGDCSDPDAEFYWFAICTNQNGEVFGGSCPPGTTANTVTAHFIPPGQTATVDIFTFNCGGASGDVTVQTATPSPVPTPTPTPPIIPINPVAPIMPIGPINPVVPLAP